MPRLLTIRSAVGATLGQRSGRPARLRAGPLLRERFPVKDGRNATLNNNAFGTVYGAAGEKPRSVCTYAVRLRVSQMPVEQLTINVFEDFLRSLERRGSSS